MPSLQEPHEGRIINALEPSLYMEYSPDSLPAHVYLKYMEEESHTEEEVRHIAAAKLQQARADLAAAKRHTAKMVLAMNTGALGKVDLNDDDDSTQEVDIPAPRASRTTGAWFWLKVLLVFAIGAAVGRPSAETIEVERCRGGVCTAVIGASEEPTRWRTRKLGAVGTECVRMFSRRAGVVLFDKGRRWRRRVWRATFALTRAYAGRKG